MITGNFAKNVHKFRLITFDVTDTLLRFARPPSTEYIQTVNDSIDNRTGIHLNENDVELAFRSSFKFMATKYPNFGAHDPQMDWHDWWTELIRTVFYRVRSGLSDDQIHRISRILIAKYETAECWNRIDQSVELVNRLKDLNKTVGIISNFDPRLRNIVRNSKLPDFDFILTSYEVGYAKPRREIFQQALKCAGFGFDTTDALHIGNTLTLDYNGAINAGFKAVLIGMEDDPNVNRNHVFPSLPEFVRALENDVIEW